MKMDTIKYIKNINKDLVIKELKAREHERKLLDKIEKLIIEESNKL